MLSRVAVSATVLVLAGLAACAPIRDVRGYVPDDEKVASVRVGADTRDTVQDKLGTPSSTATFGEPTWYYISTEQERYAFFKPDVTKRQILAVQFSEDGKVADIRTYGIEDGQVISLVDRETPSRGKEMSFLQQMFGNMGAAPPSAPGSRDSPTRPGGSGE
ncbi:MAG: outer membrane protein assembly factor BamE [Alphaproteobacteria bacterium]|nr:outer membrane protein assembly factor BamE [Alphaproteobacteria bacterium]